MDRAVPDLLTRAAALLSREAARLPGAFGAVVPPMARSELGVPSEGARAVDAQVASCPIAGAAMPGGMPGAELLPAALRKQAHELVESLLAAVALPRGLAYPSLSGGDALPTPRSALGKTCPITQAAPRVPGFDRDQLRQQAHQFIETLLVTFNDASGEKGLPAEDQVPLLSAAAPVQPGEIARAKLTIANEEALPAEVSLYSTNFVADCGYDIPSLRVTVAPRQLTIPANGAASFEVSVAVPQQTPRGRYAGLIQAMGYTYFKAVLCVDVL